MYVGDPFNSFVCSNSSISNVYLLECENREIKNAECWCKFLHATQPYTYVCMCIESQLGNIFMTRKILLLSRALCKY